MPLAVRLSELLGGFIMIYFLINNGITIAIIAMIIALIAMIFAQVELRKALRLIERDSLSRLSRSSDSLIDNHREAKL